MLLHNSVSLNFGGYQVYNPKIRRCIGLLLVLCMSADPVWAGPFQQPSWKQNMKLGIELGFGAPYGWALTREDVKKLGREDVKKLGLDKIEVSPNWRLGAVFGYGFPFLDDTLAIGPETGLFIGTKEKSSLFFVVGLK